MSGIQDLLMVLDAAEKARDDAVSAMESARQAHESARQQSQSLTDWRQEYQRRWQTQFQQSGGMEIVQGTDMRVSVPEAKFGVQEVKWPAGESQPLETGDIVQVYSAVSAASSTQLQNRLVRVSGEVRHPGEYVLPAGASLEDAVKAAGGYTDNAPIVVQSALEKTATLVLLTRHYPKRPSIFQFGGRTYLQPSRPVPVSTWDCTAKATVMPAAFNSVARKD